MVTNILVGGILNTMWKTCDSISPMQGSGATSRASLPSRKFLCPRWNSIQFWWFEGATPLKIQYAVPCPGPLPCQFHSSLKWLHNCTGSATWCACNAKAKLISNKVSCEHPGGGRDEVCQWCTWHIEAELGWRTAASISLYTELLQLVSRCLKQIFPVNSPACSVRLPPPPPPIRVVSWQVRRLSVSSGPRLSVSSRNRSDSHFGVSGSGNSMDILTINVRRYARKCNAIIHVRKTVRTHVRQIVGKYVRRSARTNIALHYMVLPYLTLHDTTCTWHCMTLDDVTWPYMTVYVLY